MSVLDGLKNILSSYSENTAFGLFRNPPVDAVQERFALTGFPAEMGVSDELARLHSWCPWPCKLIHIQEAD